MTSFYLSSSCTRSHRIVDAVRRIEQAGWPRVELTGGTEWYPEIFNDLERLRRDGVQLLCHNYFPPPRESFVVNLASLDEEIRTRSIKLVHDALELSARLGAREYGVHAGFLVDLRVGEAGLAANRQRLYDRKESIARFVDAHVELADCARRHGVRLYLENNVYGQRNHALFGADCPFLLTCSSDYAELADRMAFSLLLDVAHLKVSCATLHLDFRTEFAHLAQLSDYWHISDNDAAEDTNEPVGANTLLARILAEEAYLPRLATIEVDGLEAAISSARVLSAIFGNSKGGATGDLI